MANRAVCYEIAALLANRGANRGAPVRIRIRAGSVYRAFQLLRGCWSATTRVAAVSGVFSIGYCFSDDGFRVGCALRCVGDDSFELWLIGVLLASRVVHREIKRGEFFVFYDDFVLLNVSKLLA